MILDTGERSGSVEETAVEEDIKSFPMLSARSPDSFKVMQLKFGDYSKEFAECSSVLVDLKTLKLKFINQKG
ncbi:hypothetical protein [Paenibacillus tyrfis]|uniref:hypothetical protein n=1 Tax=Paenibacillus tyrfis TaxID=1501230 RepID=UPI000B593BBD|nr:hypothetical protein [Paenibacillus tyrfis]